MKKIIILTILLFAATLFVAFLYFSNLSVESNKNERVISLIPADAGMVLEYTNDKSFYEIFKDYSLFAEIIGKKHQAKLEQLKNFFQTNAQVSKLLGQQKIYLSLHHEKDSVEFLWISTLASPLPAENFSQSSQTDGHILAIQLNNTHEPFYLFIKDDLIAGSFSKQLLERSVQPNSPKIAKNFITHISSKTAGSENSLLNLYVNYQTLLPFLGRFYREKLGGNYALLNNTDGFSALNMNFKSNAIMFNGITDLETANPNYLTLFLAQKPGKTTLQRIIPLSTANFVQFNLSDYKLFETDLRKLFERRKELEKLSDQISTISTETGINPERDIRNLWANEFITFQTANHERYGAVKLKDGRKLEFLLEPLSEAVSPQVRRLRYSSLFYFYFGDAFKAFRRPYFLITDNYLVFANSATALRNYQSDYNKENFLFKTPRFTSFEQLLPNQANISLFIHNSNSKSLTKSSLRSVYAKNFANNDHGLKDFYGLSYKLSSDDGHFFTNLYIGYKQDAQAEAFSTDSLLTDTGLKPLPQ